MEEQGKFNIIILGIIFDPKKKKILIGKRENDPHIPELTWCFPGGELLIGEEIDTALKNKIQKKFPGLLSIVSLYFSDLPSKKKTFYHILGFGHNNVLSIEQVQEVIDSDFNPEILKIYPKWGKGIWVYETPPPYSKWLELDLHGDHDFSRAQNRYISNFPEGYYGDNSYTPEIMKPILQIEFEGKVLTSELDESIRGALERFISRNFPTEAKRYSLFPFLFDLLLSYFDVDLILNEGVEGIIKNTQKSIKRKTFLNRHDYSVYLSQITRHPFQIERTDTIDGPSFSL